MTVPEKRKLCLLRKVEGGTGVQTAHRSQALHLRCRYVCPACCTATLCGHRVMISAQDM